jgi:hypothetical protein
MISGIDERRTEGCRCNTEPTVVFLCHDRLIAALFDVAWMNLVDLSSALCQLGTPRPQSMTHLDLPTGASRTIKTDFNTKNKLLKLKIISSSKIVANFCFHSIMVRSGSRRPKIVMCFCKKSAKMPWTMCAQLGTWALKAYLTIQRHTNDDLMLYGM